MIKTSVPDPDDISVRIRIRGSGSCSFTWNNEEQENLGGGPIVGLHKGLVVPGGWQEGL